MHCRALNEAIQKQLVEKALWDTNATHSYCKQFLVSVSWEKYKDLCDSCKRSGVEVCSSTTGVALLLNHIYLVPYCCPSRTF